MLGRSHKKSPVTSAQPGAAGLSARKKLVFATGLVLIVVTLSTAYWFFALRTPSAETNVCKPGSSIHYRLVTAIQRSDRGELDKLAGQIMRDSKHQDDPNCLVGLIEYNLAKSNTTEASRYMERLKRVADDSTELSADYKLLFINTVKDARLHLEDRLRLREEANANTLLF